jgi:hypothetical protein
MDRWRYLNRRRNRGRPTAAKVPPALLDSVSWFWPVKERSSEAFTLAQSIYRSY